MYICITLPQAVTKVSFAAMHSYTAMYNLQIYMAFSLYLKLKRKLPWCRIMIIIYSVITRNDILNEDDLIYVHPT
jgi:hypothetical protein